MSGIVERNKRFIPACAGNSTVKASKVSIVAVHPRLRGELYIPVRILRRFFGSSPLARGTLHSRSDSQAFFRFIPACAGNSYRVHVPGTNRSVHPRLRGELSVFPNIPGQIYGSSPLARGTQPKEVEKNGF